MMEVHELENLIKQQLDVFYERRILTLSKLDLGKTLKRKNPYLFRALGIQKASEIVEQLLQAFMSASDESVFGTVFLEPIAKQICGGITAGTSGLDVITETPEIYTVIQIKSGPNWGNSSQWKQLKRDFSEAQEEFIRKQLKKQFRALLGQCYGRRNSEPDARRIYAIRSGQAFWEEITGDSDFYLKLIRLMKDYPLQHRIEFEKAWAQAVNRFELEFLKDFATPEGAIDWEKIVQLSSGKSPPKKKKKQS
ncbi:MAG: hypothetical protein KME26_06305 [Oscillatoria princeps RMCB-10]|nr:hypothetical protein [Oscillatoria princeps RMCB-10]